jgi:hypothetical protein
MSESKEIIEDEVIKCLQDIEQYCEDNDFITIQEYGGAPDESFLKGTKNAIRLFALDLLRSTCDIERESGIMGGFDEHSVASIDYVHVSSDKVEFNKPFKSSFKDKFISCIFFLVITFFLLCTLMGLVWIVNIVGG